MVNRSNSERLRGFGDRLTDRQTDRRTFAILESLSQLKSKRKGNVGVFSPDQTVLKVQIYV